MRVSFTQHLKRETTKAFQEMAVLRAELGRAEAAVEGGKKQRDTDIAALEDKLKKCQQDLHRSETEVGTAVSEVEGAPTLVLHPEAPSKIVYVRTLVLTVFFCGRESLHS